MTEVGVKRKKVISEKYLEKYKAITTKVTEGNYIKITEELMEEKDKYKDMSDELEQTLNDLQAF